MKTVGLKEKSQVQQRQVETEISKFSRQAYNFQGDFIDNVCVGLRGEPTHQRHSNTVVGD